MAGMKISGDLRWNSAVELKLYLGHIGSTVKIPRALSYVATERSKGSPLVILLKNSAMSVL